MDKETAYSIIKITDIDLARLRMTMDDLEKDKDYEVLINRLKQDYCGLPGRVEIKVEDEYVIISYLPEIMDEEDEKLFGKTINLLTEKKYNAGKEYLIKLVEKYPLNSQILYNLGMCYTEMGQAEKSLKPLEQAVKVTPFFANAYVALGVSYSRLKNYEKALECGLEAIKYDSKNFYAYRNVAACYGSLSNFEKALEYNSKALEIDENDPQALYLHAHIFKEKGNVEEADKYFKKITDNGINAQIIELAKRERTELADKELLSKGIRMDAVMYFISILNLFEGSTKEKVKQITFAASIMGINGFEINNPNKKYYFKELDKECTGLQMLCYMYAGFQIIDPSMKVGIDLSKEFNMAKEMKKHGYS